MRHYYRVLLVVFTLLVWTCLPVWAASLRIALPAFENNTGDQNLDFLKEELADRLSEKLQNVEEIDLIERKRFQEVVKEMALHQTGAIEESTVSKMGKLLGAERLLYGNILQTELGKEPTYKFSIRVVDVESALVLKRWSSSGKINELEAMVASLAGEISDYTKAEVTLRNLANLTHSEPPFKIELWTDKKRCKVGETITIYFRSEKDCYLTLIDITTSGKLYILFPNRFATDNYIKAGRTYMIPGPDHPFAITAGEPLGFERLKAIATLQNIDLAQTKVGEGKQLFVNLPDPSKATRDLNLVIINTPQLTWSDAYHEVIIE
jgi:hypothetical protein